ncbi:ubiquitin C-terminal hydrolase [Exophiala viscosa]|uniref:ubiquitinyl hydrolase 1 n=1 Tax=Exophiala viscosa TaxID=2486360 RepID=A0AAN6DTD8_9EURO|nr:ubiquitin C-terminal hydrolase [Exophiala viscosa]
MSGVHRFLSKREGKHNRDSHVHHNSSILNKKPPPAAVTSSPELVLQAVDPNSATDFYGLFDAYGGTNQVEEQKVRTLRQRLIDTKGVVLRHAQILWALRSYAATGDVDAAYDLLLALSDASEGIVTGYDPTKKLLGAVNRQGVTCFLDATLFAMFSRLDSFEAMLYNTFEDVPRNKLGFVLRVWVNLLRRGKLITTDFTKILQDTLAECGWEEAAEVCQQDASEAFTFITGKLDLPLLTLKMDIYHTGKEDTNDDHKFINERLLEVAIRPDPTGQRNTITLEECLEDYFNNRIEVRRYMERRATLSSMRKSSTVHIETVEIDPDSGPSTPTTSPTALPGFAPTDRPVNRHRAHSIIQERYVPPQNDIANPSLARVQSLDSGRHRAGSMRKEVMMPAWQFFSLIPWYTDNAPINDAQVAAHFSSKRPILGLCLKRYSMSADGTAARLDTQIDIPVEIGVPHFIQDEHMEEAGSLFGNFKLSLQSVVCHRGYSVDSGHYIALVRGSAPPNSANGTTADPSSTWMRFDDLAQDRITVVDIEKALKEETPYLLFYQIVPVDGDPGYITSGEETLNSTSERGASASGRSSASALTENQPISGRGSLEISVQDDSRGRSPTESRRASVVEFVDHPPDRTADTSLQVPRDTDASTGSRRVSLTLSQAQNRASEGLGRTLSKLTKRKSRDVQFSEVKNGGPTEEGIQTEIHVKELPNRPLPEKKPEKIIVRQEAPQGETPKSHHKREKSRGRLSRSRAHGEKPDRECIVM